MNIWDEGDRKGEGRLNRIVLRATLSVALSIIYIAGASVLQTYLAIAFERAMNIPATPAMSRTAPTPRAA